MLGIIFFHLADSVDFLYTYLLVDNNPIFSPCQSWALLRTKNVESVGQPDSGLQQLRGIQKEAHNIFHRTCWDMVLLKVLKDYHWHKHARHLSDSDNDNPRWYLQIIDIKLNRVESPNWPEANQVAIYKGDRGVELGTTENQSSERSRQGLNMGPPD